MSRRNRKILISDKVYVPARDLKKEDLEELYMRDLFKENTCRRCEYREARPCEACVECPGYVGRYRTYARRVIRDEPYYGLPIGNYAKIRKLLDPRDYQVYDARKIIPFRQKNLEFTGTLRDYQEESIQVMITRRYGLLQAPPRSGKTVMATALILEKGLKALVLVHQNELINQFYNDTLMNPDLTNIADVEKFEGRKFVGICKEVKDFKRYDICLATYQQFLSKKGQRKLQKIKQLFSVLVVDEIHKANADCFSRVVNQFIVKHRYGLTATPNRKDGREFLVRDICGPIAHESEVTLLTPRVTVFNTNVKPKRNYSQWVYAMRFLELHTGRNRMIVQHALNDIKRGHSIVIPVTFTRHADTLVNMINSAAGKTVAAKFDGKISKKQRDENLEKAKRGKIKCIVANRNMLLGINVPKWSCIYEIIPINNPPNFEQEVMRICTPLEGKRQPMIKFFVDDMQMVRACFKSCCGTLNELHEKYGEGFTFTKKGRQRRDGILSIFYRGNRWRRRQGDPDAAYNPFRR